MAPIAILEYVERTGQTATSALLSITSLQDNFILKRRPASIVALPIMLQSKVAGILYLDSPIPSAFSASDLSIISSLSTQALLALERTTYSRLLELKVEERTAELSQRNKELELARKAAEDAKEAENRFLLRMSHGKHNFYK
jgi:GAF domain-containing protein